MKYLTFLLLSVFAKDDNVCDIPEDFLNGSVEEVKRSADRQFFVGIFKCNPGYTLSGSSLVKCRRGRWSHKPLCLGSFDYKMFYLAWYFLFSDKLWSWQVTGDSERSENSGEEDKEGNVQVSVQQWIQALWTIKSLLYQARLEHPLPSILFK